jgi:hypothetical protein
LDNSHYFYRTAVFADNNGQPALADINNPTQVTPLEPWFGLVYPLADGKHTFGELTQHVAQSYQGNPPPDLHKTLVSVLERLIEGKLIATSDKAVELPYYLTRPVELLNVEKAKELMAKDGLTLQ